VVELVRTLVLGRLFVVTEIGIAAVESGVRSVTLGLRWRRTVAEGRFGLLGRHRGWNLRDGA